MRVSVNINGKNDTFIVSNKHDSELHNHFFLYANS